MFYSVVNHLTKQSKFVKVVEFEMFDKMKHEIAPTK